MITNLTLLEKEIEIIASWPNSNWVKVGIDRKQKFDNIASNLPGSLNSVEDVNKILDECNTYLIKHTVRSKTFVKRTFVDLSSLKLTRIPTKAVKGLSTLFYDEAELRNIPDSLHKNLTQIFKLNLKDNCLTTLPTELARLSGLELLDLSGNALTHLPNVFDHFNKLKELYLNDNQLRQLPLSIFNCRKLEKLSVTGNRLEQLPPQVGNLKLLRFLYLDKNQLKSIPEEIENCKKLMVLELGENQLSKIPQTIGQLEFLKVLTLCNNNLESSPTFSATMSSLEAVFLSNNRINDLPNVTQLEKLEILHAARNQITNLPEDVFKTSKLKELNLFGNQFLPGAFDAFRRKEFELIGNEKIGAIIKLRK